MHKLRDAPGDIEEDLRRQLKAIAGTGRVYVLGLGNTDRADDGAGVLVARSLKKLFPSHSYSEHDGVEGTVLDISERDEDAIVLFVDAANIGAEPGSIRIVKREAIKETEISTHRVAVALMAAILERSGKQAAVIAVQPKSVEFQGTVTKPVKEATRKLVGVLSEIMKDADG